MRAVRSPPLPEPCTRAGRRVSARDTWAARRIRGAMRRAPRSPEARDGALRARRGTSLARGVGGGDPMIAGKECTMRSARFVVSIGLAALAGSCASAGEVNDEGTDEAALGGAVFTTTGDGIRVNANVYTSKDAVYLDGGPGASAKPGAAALPAGNYYFQVTDPSGKALLSSDPVRCRAFHIAASGVIDAVIVANGCEHATGVD